MMEMNANLPVLVDYPVLTVITFLPLVGGVIRVLQSGQIHHYAIVLAFGALALIITGLVVL